MEIGERIKAVRKAAGCTQQAFADRLGLKRNTIGGYEIGAVFPSDRTIADICEKFNVREEWLRDGSGDMNNPISREEELGNFIGDLMKGETGDFRRRLVYVLSRLDAEEWKLLEKMAVSLVEEMKNADPE